MQDTLSDEKKMLDWSNSKMAKDIFRRFLLKKLFEMTTYSCSKKK